MATMATSTRQSTRSRTFHREGTVILSLLGIATAAYIAVMPVEYAAPEMNEAAWFASDGPIFAPESASEQTTSQAAAGPAVAVQTEPAAPRNSDSFPDEYVNHASTANGPAATF
jgi:hypothetical protein